MRSMISAAAVVAGLAFGCNNAKADYISVTGYEKQITYFGSVVGITGPITANFDYIDLGGGVLQILGADIYFNIAGSGQSSLSISDDGFGTGSVGKNSAGIFTSFEQNSGQTSYIDTASFDASAASGVNFQSGKVYSVVSGSFGANFQDNGVTDLAISFTPITIGINTVATVPLPASAPLFGAALLGIASLGYAAKRKKAAAV